MKQYYLNKAEPKESNLTQIIKMYQLDPSAITTIVLHKLSFSIKLAAKLCVTAIYWKDFENYQILDGPNIQDYGFTQVF